MEAFKTFYASSGNQGSQLPGADMPIKRHGADRTIELSEETRRNHLKALIGQQLKDENLRSALINEELKAIKYAGSRTTRASNAPGKVSFPTTTN